MWVVICSVTVIVSAYFIASQKIADKIAETNERIDNWVRVLESQQNLIMTNRARDSAEKAFIELQIEYLKDQIKNRKK